MADGSDSEGLSTGVTVHDSPVNQNTYVFVYLLAMAVSAVIFAIYW